MSAIIACYWLARRASRVDLNVALRELWWSSFFRMKDVVPERTRMRCRSRVIVALPFSGGVIYVAAGMGSPPVIQIDSP